jgi:FeS assembly protein IscX|tara:strand:+ start:427 stop:624 length:198 start_codon:yes stop_codon:yes gene_type:complete
MMNWTDSLEIAIALEESHPEIDPKKINFVDLRQFVSGLDEFKEGDSRCGERVLEAIQMHWIEEKS